MTSLAADIRVRKLGYLDRAQAYAFDLARSAARLAIRRVRRTTDVVASEYDGGHWSRILKERGWEHAPDLASFLIGSERRSITCKIDGAIVSAPSCEYYRYRLVAFSGLMTALAGVRTTELVELGTGYGYNLLSLAAGKRFSRLQGFDVSQVGIEAGRQIAARFGIADYVSFDRLDLTNAKDPQFTRIAGKTCFTYFVIEQLPYSVDAVLANIIANRPRRVIHVEPTTELLRWNLPREWVSFLYNKSVDYQTRLFSHINELEQAGTIRVIHRDRMPFAPSIHNDGFVISWELAP